MKSLGYSAQVGLVVLIVIALAGWGIYYLRKGLTGTATYKVHVLFTDATGIESGVDVTMAGVTVGKVDKMILRDLKADLTLSIKKEDRIPVGSHFSIFVPPLGGDGYVEIVAPAGVTAQTPKLPLNGAVVQGEQAPDITAALNNANSLMIEFQGTAKRLNKVLDETSTLIGDQSLQKGLHESLTNLEAASENASQLTGQMSRYLAADNGQVQGMLTQTSSGTKIALSNIDATTADFRSVTQQNKSALNEIIGNMRDTTAALQGITSQTNDMLGQGGISKNLSQITANMAETTKKLDAVAGNIQQLSSDPSMQGDLKATIHNLSVTTQEMSYTVERVNHLIGVKSHETGAPAPSTTTAPPSTKTTSRLPVVEPRLDMLQNVRDHRFRADLNALVPFGATGGFAQAGVFGIGDANRLNLEYGTLAPAGSPIDIRAGLHASKLGVGADWGLWRRESISADLYDPNYAHLDLHGTWMLNQNVGLLLGGDDLTKRSSAVVGVELRN